MIRLGSALACCALLAGAAVAEVPDLDAVMKALAGYRYGDSVAVTRSVAGLVRDSYGNEEARARLRREMTGLLSGGATPDAKRFVLAQLALIGTPAEVPAISALRSSTEFADPARRALESILGPPAVAGSPSGGGGGRPLPEVLDALDDPDAEGFASALRALREMPGPLPHGALKQRLAELEPGDQVAVLGALSRRPEASGREAAEWAAEQGNGSVKMAGLRALGRLGDASAILLLARASASLSGESRDAARKSLDSLRGETVDAAMSELLVPATPPGIRGELARSLAARGAAGAAPVIEGMAGDQDKSVRLAAARALGVLALDRSRGSLIALLLEEMDRGVREAAMESLKAVAKEFPKQSGGPVLEALDGASPEACRALLHVLPSIGGTTALDAVRRRLEDPADEVVNAAIRALGEWPEPGPLDELIVLSRSGAGQTQRVLALRGAVRLAGLPAERPAAETAAMLAALLAAAPGPEEAKLVLAGLGKAADPAALRAAAGKLGDPELREEAVSAIAGIASRVGGEHPEEAAEALRQALRAKPGKESAAKARKLLASLEKQTEFISAWEVAGPFRDGAVNDEGLLHDVFPPEAEPRKAEWKAPARDPKSETPWQVDLGRAVGGEHCVAYLRTHLWVPRRTKLRLEIGSDDGVKVWVGGKEVHANNAWRPVKDGEDTVKVTLESGWTPVLLKITQGKGLWGASLRVRGGWGRKVQGLRAQARPPA